MPSAPPNATNDYRFDPAPAEAHLDRAVWDAVMGGTDPDNPGIGPRLRALEAKRVELQAVINDLRLFGLERLDTAIVPLIQETQGTIAGLQQAVADTLEQNGQVIETFQGQVAAALQSLNDELEALQERIDLILAGGIPADDVAETAGRVFVTPAQKAEIGELRSDLEALLLTLDDTFAAIGSGKENKSAKNQPNGYAGLDSDGKVPNSLLRAPVEVGDVVRSARQLASPKYLRLDGGKYLKSAFPDLWPKLPLLAVVSSPISAAVPSPNTHTANAYGSWVKGGHYWVIGSSGPNVLIFDIRDASMRSVALSGAGSSDKYAGAFYREGMFYFLYYDSVMKCFTLDPVTLANASVAHNMTGVGNTPSAEMTEANGTIYVPTSSGVYRGPNFSSMSAITLASGYRPDTAITVRSDGVAFFVSYSFANIRINASVDQGLTWTSTHLTLPTGNAPQGSAVVPQKERVIFEFAGKIFVKFHDGGSGINTGYLYEVTGSTGQNIRLVLSKAQIASAGTSKLVLGNMLYNGNVTDAESAVLMSDGSIASQADFFAALNWPSLNTDFGVRESFFDPDYGFVRLIAGTPSTVRLYPLAHNPSTEFRVPYDRVKDNLTGYIRAMA